MVNAFKAAAAPKATKAKPAKHEFHDKALEKAVSQWISAKGRMQQAEQELAEAEAEILPKAEEARIEASMTAGSNQTTVVVNGKLSVSQSMRYRTVKAEAMADLSEAFGENAPRYFRTKLSIKVKETVADNEALCQALVEAVGAENIGKYFDVTESVEVTEAFHTERATNPKMAKRAIDVIARGLVAPYKAAVKLA